MIRATTPTHKFALHMKTSDISEFLITYKQNGNIVVEKSREDILTDDIGVDYINVKLTQEETRRFTDVMPAEVQVKVKTNGGNVFASKIIKVTVGEVLNDEVMT